MFSIRTEEGCTDKGADDEDNGCGTGRGGDGGGEADKATTADALGGDNGDKPRAEGQETFSCLGLDGLTGLTGVVGTERPTPMVRAELLPCQQEWTIFSASVMLFSGLTSDSSGDPDDVIKERNCLI